MGEGDVGPVEDDDLPGTDACAHFGSTGLVIVFGRVDDGEARQEALQVQPQVAFGCGLATAVFGPIQARGHQLDRGRIHHMDGPSKPTGQAPKAAAGSELRLDTLQMSEHTPEQLLGHGGVTVPACMRQTVAARWAGPSDACQPATVMPQRIAYIVQPNRVRQLRVEHRHHVTPRAETARHPLHPGLPGQFCHQVPGDVVAQLNCSKIVSFPRVGVGLLVLFFISDRYRDRKNLPTPTFSSQFLWDACVLRILVEIETGARHRKDCGILPDFHIWKVDTP